MERRRRRPLTRDHLLGIANYLTYGRIAIVAVVVGILMRIDDRDFFRSSSNITLSWLAMGFVTIAGISDAVDGYYARRHGITSSFGKFLDPLADKLLSLSVLIMLLDLERVPAWMVIVLVARDISMTALRSMATGEGIEIAASEWGKKKTLLTTIALGFLLVHYPVWGLDIHEIGMGLLWLSLGVSLASGAHYVYEFFREVLDKRRVT